MTLPAAVTLQNRGFLDMYQKYSRLRCLLRVKGLVIFFIWALLAVFFSSVKI